MASYLSGAIPGQSAPVAAWINFWVKVVKIDPTFFAYAVAAAETALALALIFGVLSNLANLCGSILSLMIWSTAEGFGGPYVIGTTDIGAAIIYVFVFALLSLSRSGLHLGLDPKLAGSLGSWAFLASGPIPDDKTLKT